MISVLVNYHKFRMKLDTKHKHSSTIPVSFDQNLFALPIFNIFLPLLFKAVVTCNFSGNRILLFCCKVWFLLEMDQNSVCQHCTTREQIYWKHFTPIHFLLSLPQDFHDHLVLPDKFSAHMKDKLQDKVFVKGPSGVSWEIELLKSDDLVFVGDEWKDFVRVNGLKENCLLVFKYERNLGFEVLVFDQGSCCEMESAYFAKNCKYDIEPPNQEDQKTWVLTDNDGEDEASFVQSKKPRKDDEALSPKKGVIAANLEVGGRPRTRRALSIARKRSFMKKKAKEVSHNSQIDVIILEDGETYFEKDDFHMSRAKSKSQGKRSYSYRKNVSNRRPVTQTEKANTFQRANQVETEDSFTVVIRPTSLYPRYLMYVPVKWLRKHPLRGNQEVVLRVGEKTWHTTYSSYACRGVLRIGWKNFVLDNLLEEFDMLVFKPVSLKDEVAVLDVEIFKVV